MNSLNAVVSWFCFFDVTIPWNLSLCGSLSMKLNQPQHANTLFEVTSFTFVFFSAKNKNVVTVLFDSIVWRLSLFFSHTFVPMSKERRCHLLTSYEKKSSILLREENLPFTYIELHHHLWFTWQLQLRINLIAWHMDWMVMICGSCESWLWLVDWMLRILCLIARAYRMTEVTIYISSLWMFVTLVRTVKKDGRQGIKYFFMTSAIRHNSRTNPFIKSMYI